MKILRKRRAYEFNYKLAERTKMLFGKELTLEELVEEFGHEEVVLTSDEVLASTTIHSNIKNKAARYEQLFIIYPSANLVILYSLTGHKLTTPLFLNGQAGYSADWKLEKYEGQRIF